MESITFAAPAQDPTAITYNAETHMYHVTAHGLRVDTAPDYGSAETARLAWLAVYEAERATTPSIVVPSVKRAEHHITRLTGGADVVWHASALPGEWRPAEGTPFTAIMIRAEVELWALTTDGRLGTLELIFEERRPSLASAAAPTPHTPGALAEPDHAAGAPALACEEVPHAA